VAHLLARQARQQQVQDHHVVRQFLRHPVAGVPVVRHADLEAAGIQSPLDRAREPALVLNDEDVHHASLAKGDGIDAGRAS